MKVLILAAGYGTRLERDIKADTSGKYTHLIGVPKPLVPVGGIALLGHWLKALHEIESIDVSDDVFLVTNASNHGLFVDYLSKLAEETNNDIVVPPSHVIDDGTTSNEGRKGAIADIELFVRFSGIEHTEDLMIIGGDTLFYPNDFNLATIIKKFSDQSSVSDALVLYHTVADTRKTGILEIDEKTHLAKRFLEKPEPTATTARNSCPCFYLFRGTPYYQQLTYYMNSVAKELKDVDAPGTFLAWLINHNKMRILPHKIEGRFDIGGLTSYIEANEYFIKKFADDKNRTAALTAAEETNVIRRASSAVAHTVTTTSHWLLTLPTIGPLLTALMNHRCEGVCPHTSCVLAMVRGFRQGIVYGAKVRFPHAFVMTFLFRQGTFAEKVNDIFLATYQHSKNLGCYVFLYKAIQCIVRHLRKEESGLNTLISGFLAGGIMFGENNPVNTQINMYIFSRIVFGAARTLVRHNLLPDNSHTWGYPLFAATAWALVMYLFEWQNDTLQKSLVSSMIYLYQDSNKWPTDAAGITDWLVRGH